jgi:hypothetical protein
MAAVAVMCDHPLGIPCQVNHAGPSRPFNVLFTLRNCFIKIQSHTVGVWRSWLARTPGGREVAGSSPVTPTNEKRQAVWFVFFHQW